MREMGHRSQSHLGSPREIPAKALAYRYTTEEKGLMLRRYWRTDCPSCPLKARCTTGKERRITRWEHEHLIDAMYSRMEYNPNLMRTRRCTVEHANSEATRPLIPK